MTAASAAASQEGPAMSALSRSRRRAPNSLLGRTGACRPPWDAPAQRWQLGWNLAAMHNGKRLKGSRQERNGAAQTRFHRPGKPATKASDNAPGNHMGVSRNPRQGTLGAPIGY